MFTLDRVNSLHASPQITLQVFDATQHLSYLERWLASSELMHGWGGKPRSPAQVQEMVSEANSLHLMIYADGIQEPVGFVCFYAINQQTKIVERGTMIDIPYQGKGYGKAAIKASNQYIKENMGINKIVVWVKDGNERSLHVTRSLGYTYDYFDEKHHNHYFYMEV
jgi:RimJ/RimL family protein N-acetyltransferase